MPMRTAVEEGSKLLSTLPAQFLVLVLLNVAFLGFVLWFLQSEDSTHARMIQPILEHCTRSVPIEMVEKLMQR